MPATTQCPLLLESRPLLDALGYIDTTYDTNPQARQHAQHLVHQEMQTFAPSSQYLAFLDDYTPTFADHPRLQREFRRVKAKVPLNAIDLNRYQVRPPQQTEANADVVTAWKTAVDRQRTAVEYASDRVLSLELQVAYSSKLWKIRAALMDGVNAQSKQAVVSTEQASAKVNGKRKQDQLLNASKLGQLERQWTELVESNDAIQRACGQLERRLKKTKREPETTEEATTSPTS